MGDSVGKGVGDSEGVAEGNSEGVTDGASVHTKLWLQQMAYRLIIILKINNLYMI